MVFGGGLRRGRVGRRRSGHAEKWVTSALRWCLLRGRRWGRRSGHQTGPVNIPHGADRASALAGCAALATATAAGQRLAVQAASAATSAVVNREALVIGCKARTKQRRGATPAANARRSKSACHMACAAKTMQPSGCTAATGQRQHQRQPKLAARRHPAAPKPARLPRPPKSTASTQQPAKSCARPGNAPVAQHRCGQKNSPQCFRVWRRAAQTRLKTKVPLVPPKPKLFFMAYSIFRSRAVLAQKSKSHSGSW